MHASAHSCRDGDGAALVGALHHITWCTWPLSYHSYEASAPPSPPVSTQAALTQVGRLLYIYAVSGLPVRSPNAKSTALRMLLSVGGIGANPPHSILSLFSIKYHSTLHRARSSSAAGVLKLHFSPADYTILLRGIGFKLLDFSFVRRTKFATD